MATAKVISDCKLVEESEERKYDCPVCLQILRDPCISQCCRNNFCHACVLKLRKAGNPCPLCRNSQFRTQRNRVLGPKVYHLQVYCTNKSKGCDWIGDLGEIDTHLNQSPALRYQTNGCCFVDIQCCYCSQNFQRNQICDHFSVCPRRPYKCEYCHGYNSFYEDVSRNHWPICDFYPIICPNGCHECIPRHNVHDHVVKYCAMTVTECEFKQYGCTAKLTRQDMQSHMKDSVAVHESLVMMTKLFSQLKKNNREIRELETKLHEKQKSLTREQKDLFEKRISSATNQVVDTGKQQLRSVVELLHKRNEQLIKEQQKSLSTRMHKEMHSALDNTVERVQCRVKQQLDSKYADQIRELRAENTRLTNEIKKLGEKNTRVLNDVQMSFNAIVLLLLVYWLGWKLCLQIVISVWCLIILCICSPCICIFWGLYYFLQ